MSRKLLTLSLFLFLVFLVLPQNRFVCAVDETFYVVKDTHAFSYYPNNQYGSFGWINIGENVGFRISFIAFDTANIRTVVSSCVSATLVLEDLELTYTGYGLDIYVWMVTSDWAEATLTYATMPNYAAGEIVHVNVAYDSNPQTIEFDVTDFVNDWLAEGYNWYGFRLYGVNDIQIAFVESKETDASAIYLELTDVVAGGSGGSVGGWVTVPQYMQFILMFVIVGMPAFVMGAVGAKAGWGLQGLLFGGLLGLGAGIMLGIVPFWFVFLVSLMVVLFLYSMMKKS